MKGLENFKGLANGDFIKAAALTAATIFATPNVQAEDNPAYPPELEPGNCAPTSEIQQAWNKEDLEIVMGGEARLTTYNDNGEPKRDEKGDAIYQDKEYILAANQKGEWYTFIGNKEKGNGSTKFCVSIAGNNLKVPYNQDTPQSIPYDDKIDQQDIEEHLYGPPQEVQGYIFAQGHAQDSSITHTLFLTKQADRDGKNFVMYSHKDESRARINGDAAQVLNFGHTLAEQYQKKNQQLSLKQ